MPNGSHVKVTKICDGCGKNIPNQSYEKVCSLRSRGDGKDRCRECGKIIAGERRKDNVKYQNSLEYYVLNNDMKYILDEFSLNNKKKPSEISRCTDSIYYWNCPECKSVYDMSVSQRVSLNNNCPYCRGYRVNETNCLWTTHPEIAKLLRNYQRGYEITHGSSLREEFVCKDCNHVSSKVICNVVSKGLSCPRCSDGISYPEKFMMSLIKQLNVKFDYQVKLKWSENKKYDFYIPSFKCIIETHGAQHYQRGFESVGGKSLKEEQENDMMKEKLAKDNGIENYIVIDCRSSELEFIKNNIIKSKLNKLFSISSVDWEKCHIYACNSMVKEVSAIWENGIKSTTELGVILNIHRATVRKYLKQGAELGWCNYDPKKAMEDKYSISSKKTSKKVVQLDLNGKYINEFKSITEASEKSRVGYGNINSVCRSNTKTACGFIWMYKEDYNRYIESKY